MLTQINLFFNLYEKNKHYKIRVLKLSYGSSFLRSLKNVVIKYLFLKQKKMNISFFNFFNKMMTNNDFCLMSFVITRFYEGLYVTFIY